MSCLAPSANGIHTRFCNQLAQRLGTAKYGLWFGHSTSVQITDNSIVIAVPSRFHADWIHKHFQQDLDEIAEEIVRFGTEVRLEIDSSVSSQSGQSDAETAAETDVISSNAPTKPQSIGGHSGVWASTTEQPAAVSQPVDELHTNHSGTVGRIGHAGHVNHNQSAPRRNANTKHYQHKANPNDRYDLDRFVTGRCNELAFHAATQLIHGEASFNPLFIHGSCGVGKTHLLRGFCRRFRQTHHHAAVRYVTGEQFTNEYIHAIRNHKLDQFRNAIRRLDLLAIDDVHFLSNKMATQNEFLCTFDAIALSGAQVILASDNHPHLIEKFHQRLVSRFMSGMVVEINTPCRDTRVQMINEMSQRRKLTLNDAAVQAIADRCVGSVREIEGTLTRLHAMSSLLSSNAIESNHANAYLNEKATECSSQKTSNHNKEHVGMILVDRMFNETTSHMSRLTTPVQPETVLQTVAHHFRLEVSRIVSNARHKKVVLARSIAAYLIRQMTTMSYPEIAMTMSRKNHSTIIAAYKRVDTLIRNNDRLTVHEGDEPILIAGLLESLRHAILAANNANNSRR